MSLNKITDYERDSRSVEILADRPNGASRGGSSGLTPAQLKAAFSALPKYNTAKINDIIDYINGAGWITRTVADLLNYYTKSETYTREEINTRISAIPKFKIMPVEALPQTDISEATVYLLKTSTTETGNLYTEYIYVNGEWETLGTQSLDLTPYATKVWTESGLAEKVDKVEGKGLSTNDYTTAEKEKLAALDGISEFVEKIDTAELIFRLGSINSSTGAFTPSTTRIASYDKIPIKKSVTVRRTADGIAGNYTLNAAKFDEDDNFTGEVGWSNELLLQNSDGVYSFRLIIRKGNADMTNYLSDIRDMFDITETYEVGDIPKYVNGAINVLDQSKVDKVEGKGLSTNDYTTAEKEKLAALDGISELIQTSTEFAEKIDTAELIFRLGSTNSSTGAFTPSTTRIASYDKIPIKKSVKVTRTAAGIDGEYTFNAATFDEDGEFIGNVGWSNELLLQNSDGVYSFRLAIRKGNNETLTENDLPTIRDMFDITDTYEVGDIPKYVNKKIDPLIDAVDDIQEYINEKIEPLINSETPDYDLNGNFSEIYQSSDFSVPDNPDIESMVANDIYELYDSLDWSYSDMTKTTIGYASDSDGNPVTTLPIVEYVIKPRNTFAVDNQAQIVQQPTILLTSGVHAGTEKGAVYALYRFVESLISLDSTLKDLAANFVFKIIPIVNPYGFNAGTRTNARGVNINRNFSYMWDKAISDPTSSEYRGSAMYSELETQTVKLWLENNKTAIGYIDFHNCFTVGQYGWACSMPSGDKGIFSTYSRRLSDYWCDKYEIVSNEALLYYHPGETHPGPSDECRRLGIPHFATLECHASQQHGLYSSIAEQMGTEIIANYVLAIASYFQRHQCWISL